MKRKKQKQGRIDIKTSLLVLVALAAIMYWFVAYFSPNAFEHMNEKAKNFEVG
ncbi:hypothetical protein AB4Z17_08495 [Paenibacillus sp. TAF43_2]|uniref:hypothetical protein n=1 Tax=Paenibacillus sp. TAF43_2 TaxID=3233069 RepID=UPI003F99C942